MSGAFNNLSDIVKKRLDGASIGFERSSNTKTTNDHVNYLKNFVHKIWLILDWNLNLPVDYRLELL